MTENMIDEKTAQKEFTIKLKGWQITRLIGAARLGIQAEHWCAGLVQTGAGASDMESMKWISSVRYTIDEVKKQTKVKHEDRGYGEADGVIEEIDKWVNDKCEKNEKNLEELEEREHSQRCCSCSEKK